MTDTKRRDIRPIAEQVKRVTTRFMVADEMLASDAAYDDLVRSLSEYDVSVVKEAVDMFLRSRESLNRTDNLVLLLESACQNVTFRREMSRRGSEAPTREQAERVHRKISDLLAEQWGNKRYVVLSGYHADDVAAIRDANPNRVREHPTARGSWVYKRWTQGEVLLKQCRDGFGPRLLQEQLAKVDRDTWPQRVDEWTRQHTDRWTIPVDLDNNRADFDWSKGGK